MSDSDGKVEIYIDTNAKEVLKELDSVNKVFDKNTDTMKKATSATSGYEQVVNENIKLLKEAALGGNQNTEAFKKLAQQTREYQKALNDANSAVNKAIGNENAQSSGINKLAGAVKGLVGAYLGIQGIRAVFNYSSQAVQAFRTQERAVAQLNQTLQNAGVYSVEYSAQLQNLASEIQSYSNFGDEAVIKAQALGQAYIGNTKITKNLTKAVVDFAAATEMDLEQAFSLVGKSIGSSTNALGRYGVELQKGMSESQKMDAITKQLGERYEGSARNMANASTQLKNALGDLSEEVGGLLNPAFEDTENLLKRLTNWTGMWVKAIRLAEGSIRSLNTVADLQKRYALNETKFAEAMKHPVLTSLTWQTQSPAQLQKEQAEILAKIKKLSDTTNINPLKLTDDIPFTTSTTGGGGAKSANVQKAKDAYEQLQASVAAAKREIELAAITYGTSSVEVQNAFTKYQGLNTQLQSINALFDENKQKVEEQKTVFEQLSGQVENMSQNLSSSLSSNLINALRSGGNAFESFANIALNALDKVLSKLLEIAVIKPLLNSISGGFGGSFLSFFGFKNGAAFKNGNVIPFAKGSIVNKPTLFPMANGGTGLMGEAGAEAIMPLKRMNNGKLGVEASGGSNEQVVNIYNYSGADVETRKRDNNTMDVVIKRVNEALMNERTSTGFRAASQRESRKGVQAV